MKTKYFLILIILFSLGTKAQDYLIAFEVIGLSQSYVCDSVLVQNLEKGSSLLLKGSDVLHLVENIVSIETFQKNENNLKVYPNPICDYSTLEFYNPQSDKVRIEIFNSLGNRVFLQTNLLTKGKCVYKISGLVKGNYIVNVTTQYFHSSVVIISNNSKETNPTLKLESLNHLPDIKKTLKLGDLQTNQVIKMQYDNGDSLKFTAFLHGEISTELMTPKSSQTISFLFQPPYADFYVNKTNIDADTVVKFIDNSSLNSKNWLWNFGDGVTSTEQNPTHIYHLIGNYTVSLTVSNYFGDNTATKIDYITVYNDITGETGTLKDIDGNSYSWIGIGKQAWMAENLKVSHYPDGTVIPLITDNGFWAALIDFDNAEAFCFYDNDTLNNNKFGGLYTWTASTKACPEGWHLPSLAEWYELEYYLVDNGYNYDGTIGGDKSKIGKALADSIYWDVKTYEGQIGTDLTLNNASGFSARPGGKRWHEDGLFYSKGLACNWWSSDEISSSKAEYILLLSDYSGITGGFYYKPVALSVRCVKD